MKTQEPINSMVLLRGAISGLHRSRRSHDFVRTGSHHGQIGTTATTGSAMDTGATGMRLLGIAGNADEEADWVEFDLDGNQVKGWLWMMPMSNGDIVEVVAAPTGKNRYVAYAVKRDVDNLLSVYPHATAGRKAHYRKSAKAWLWCASLASLMSTFLFVMQGQSTDFLNGHTSNYLANLFALSVPFSAVIAFRVSRKLMSFVRIAEVIFKTFGWPDVENIDLRRTSKENRRENKLPNFGQLYFRYK